MQFIRILGVCKILSKLGLKFRAFHRDSVYGFKSRALTRLAENIHMMLYKEESRGLDCPRRYPTSSVPPLCARATHTAISVITS
jgi:hypothetical protein